MNIHKKNKSDIHTKSSDKEDRVIFGVTSVFSKQNQILFPMNSKSSQLLLFQKGNNKENQRKTKLFFQHQRKMKIYSKWEKKKYNFKM